MVLWKMQVPGLPCRPAYSESPGEGSGELVETAAKVMLTPGTRVVACVLRQTGALGHGSAESGQGQGLLGKWALVFETSGTLGPPHFLPSSRSSLITGRKLLGRLVKCPEQRSSFLRSRLVLPGEVRAHQHLACRPCKPSGEFAAPVPEHCMGTSRM